MPYDRFAWCCNTVWLHKQPLFMWQMALSMKLFGVSELSIRYPSVLMGALVTVMVYKLGKIVLKDDFSAIAAALLMCCCNYHLELISGYNGTDHNDVAFGFYVLASVYFYARYTENKKTAFAVLTGLCAGCAVMNKWLTGSVVFLGWGINLVLSLRERESKKELAHFLVSIVVCTAIFMPWQWYILHTFPDEARYEYAYNARHITEVIEDHKGKMLFYVAKFPLYYGIAASIFLPVGLWRLFNVARKTYFRRQAATTALIVIFMAVMGFFSIVVKTKWVPYAFVVVPIGFIFSAAGINAAGSVLKRGSVPVILLLGVTIVFALRPWDILKAHNPDDIARQNRIYNTQVYKNIKTSLPQDIKLVLNTNSFEDLDLMFYHNDIVAYPWYLDGHVVDSLKKANVHFAVFPDHGQYKLPPSITTYPNVFVIPSQLK